MLEKVKCGEFSGKWMQRSFVHGMVGGGLACISGGNFSDGFAAGFAGELASRGINPHINTGSAVIDMASRATASAVVGGTASALMGGNFENGARTAAFGYLYNRLNHLIPEVCDTWFGQRSETGMSAEQYALCKDGLHKGEMVAMVFAGADMESGFESGESINLEKSIGSFENGVVEFERVGSALKTDPYHSFPDLIDNFASDGTRCTLKGGFNLYQVEGSLNHGKRI